MWASRWGHYKIRGLKQGECTCACKHNSLYVYCICMFSQILVWLVLLAQVWTHYKIEKLNMWPLFCNACIKFLNSQIWKEIMLELNGKPSSVTTSSIDFSSQNLVFRNLFVFSAQKPLKNQYLPQSESKSYQINSIKSSSSGSFQQHRRHIPIPLKFLATI